MSAELAMLLRERDTLRIRVRSLSEARAIASSRHGVDSFEARAARAALGTAEARLSEINARVAVLQRDDNERRAAHNAARTQRRRKGDRRAEDLIADSHRMLIKITKSGRVPEEAHMLIGDLALWLKENGAAVGIALLMLIAGCSAAPAELADAAPALELDMATALDLLAPPDLNDRQGPPDAAQPPDLTGPPPDMAREPCGAPVNCIDARDQSTCSGTCAAGFTCARSGYNGPAVCIPCGLTGERCCHQPSVPYCVSGLDYCRNSDGPTNDRCTTSP